jgi:hypothetical protein
MNARCSVIITYFDLRARLDQQTKHSVSKLTILNLYYVLDAVDVPVVSSVHERSNAVVIDAQDARKVGLKKDVNHLCVTV